MYNTILIILKAQIIVIGIISLSSFFEMTTDLKLIIWNFKLKKILKWQMGRQVFIQFYIF